MGSVGVAPRKSVNASPWQPPSLPPQRLSDPAKADTVQTSNAFDMPVGPSDGRKSRRTSATTNTVSSTNAPSRTLPNRTSDPGSRRCSAVTLRPLLVRCLQLLYRNAGPKTQGSVFWAFVGTGLSQHGT